MEIQERAQTRSLFRRIFPVLLTAVILFTSGCGSSRESSSPEPSSRESSLPADGTYVPSSFTSEGGTGKVKITCPQVTVKGGEAEAELCFSSPHYEWLKVEGTRYEPVNSAEEKRETSLFRVPVRLEEKMEISGLTTAMSEPHEITYTIRISLKEEEAGAAASENTPAKGVDTEAAAEAGPPALEGLTFVSAMDLKYARTFGIYTYQAEDDSVCRLIDVYGSGRYLLLQDGAPVPAGLPEDITVLRLPLQNIYVAATSSMALFDAAGAIGQVRFTGTDSSGWYIDAPKKALESKSMLYAGKYSAPDYELLTASGCDLAVESMMILHAPEVKEKLEELGIPVFIDASSKERHPLGRTEWIRLYGVLTGHEEEAEAFFEGQAGEFSASDSYEKTGKTVAFFSITSTGNVIVRASDDYIPAMIELAGGTYVFKDLLSRNGNSASVRLSMEEFYNTARDADFLVYNATIEQPWTSTAQLCGQYSLFKDFAAVRDGHVWQVKRSLYQSPDIAARMITDLHRMLTGEDAEGMTFLEKLE